MRTFLLILAVVVAILVAHSAIAAKRDMSRKDKPEKKDRS